VFAAVVNWQQALHHNAALQREILVAVNQSRVQ
jgi:hypothetical protein